MDEVKWYENSSLESIKNIIKDNINTASRSFVAIGYYLKNVRDRNLYQQDGYQDIWEFAQAEFGFSQSWASRYMSVNDRFSKDGNSPMIQDKYKDFSSSKLSEMLALTDEQLDQVTLTTTRAEIRNLKSYAHAHKTELEEKTVEPVHLEPVCYDKLAAYWCKREMTIELYELAKSQNDEDIDVFNQYFDEKYMRSECYAPAYNTSGYEISFKTNKNGIYFDDEKKTVYSWEVLIDLVCQEAKNDTPASKPINFHENDNGLKRLKDIRRERKAKSKETKIEKTVPEHKELVNKIVGTVTEESESVTAIIQERACANCRYNDMTPIEFKVIDPDGGLPCNSCDDKLDKWVPKIDNVNDIIEKSDFPCDTCGHDINGCCDYDDESDWCELGSAWIPKEDTEQVETIEADIIQTVLANEEPADYEKYSFQDVKDEFDKLTEYVATYRKTNETMPGRRKAKMRLDAITFLDKEMQKPRVAEEPDLIQPELPVLKNNDQRKEFIDNYTSWPVWIDQELTGERYYRYDFGDGTSFVIRVSLRHTYKNYERTKEIEHGHEEYFLLGVKNKWIPGMPTFTESSSNKSVMVEHLKEIQKKGA